MAEGEKAGRGRPAKRRETRKRVTQSYRVTEAKKAELQAAADKNEWSVSEEVEFRIARYDDLLLFFETFHRNPDFRDFINIASRMVWVGNAYARHNGLSEIEARKVMRLLFSKIEDVFFWDGSCREVRLDHDNRDALDDRPEMFAYRVTEGTMASEHVSAGKCEMYGDWSEGLVRDVWSGAGDKPLKIPRPTKVYVDPGADPIVSDEGNYARLGKRRRKGGDDA